MGRVLYIRRSEFGWEVTDDLQQPWAHVKSHEAAVEFCRGQMAKRRAKDFMDPEGEEAT